ncbi:AraC family transcriptional regulator [Ideonella sp. DXS29W]|uniref:AraC family transcriptional regulator n=1 Tax=Ideonella lacteola TaxID=2984193 RepID=A0ABU9BYA3_9BURK
MVPSVDRLSALLEHFRVRAHLFHAGPLCGTTHFAAQPGRAFLHVLKRGEMSVTHRPRGGAPQRVEVREPTLLFYPRPFTHDFHNAPVDGADFACATLDFDGGDQHPLVQSLPPLICLPLARVEGLEAALHVLFAETERLRCGSRLLADRMFEVVLIQLLRWLVDHPAEAGIPPGLITGLSDERLARTLVALHAQPGEAWNLQRMAECAAMSRSAFAVLFKDRVGQTPADYLARWRLSLAQTRLRRGDSVKMIAADLGYANPSALSRLFAQKLGQSPRQWREDAERG